MEEESRGQCYHLPSYGMALMRYLDLPTRLFQREHLEKEWRAVYEENGCDPIETVVEFFGNVFPMLDSGERMMRRDEFCSRRDLVLERVKEREAREKYESGLLDKLLIEQGRRD